MHKPHVITTRVFNFERFKFSRILWLFATHENVTRCWVPTKNVTVQCALDCAAILQKQWTNSRTFSGHVANYITVSHDRYGKKIKHIPHLSYTRTYLYLPPISLWTHGTLESLNCRWSKLSILFCDKNVKITHVDPQKYKPTKKLVLLSTKI